ncbi:MAG: hypothetical protein COB59_05445 [Rhodospirillaceae bacterium]|nr:MAG: hypothetical protein COB59_05445 [Rhodospirillaceae bacterium]
MENSSSLIAQANLDAGRALPIIPKSASLAKMREKAEDFEAVFLAQMLKPMFEGIKSDDMFGGGNGEDMWKSQLVNEYGKTIAKSGGIGIADAVLGEMLRMQEMQ